MISAFSGAAGIPALARVLTPIVNDVYSGAKKIGAKGMISWEQRSFPQRLARKIKFIENVKTIWRPDGSISLREFFYCPRIILGGSKKIATRISDFNGSNIIIEGIVGQGKSVYLRSLAVEEVFSNDAKRLPIFIELRSINQKNSLHELIAKFLDGIDVVPDKQTLDYLYGSGRISILLDGFDEIEEKYIRDTLRDMEELIIKYPDLQIIVTSRPGHDVQKSALFEKVRIAPLVFSDVAPFLDKLKVDSKKSTEIRKAIKHNPGKIEDLIITPLMLTLVVLVYESESEIPETMPEFFEKLFSTVFTRHDHLKAAFARQHFSGISERRIQS